MGLPKLPQSLVVVKGPETQLQDTASSGLVLSSETSKNLTSTTENNFRMSQYEVELERDFNIDLSVGLIEREVLEEKKMLTEVLRYGLLRRAVLKRLCAGHTFERVASGSITQTFLRNVVSLFLSQSDRRVVSEATMTGLQTRR